MKSKTPGNSKLSGDVRTESAQNTIKDAFLKSSFSLLIFLFATTCRGDWLLFVTFFTKDKLSSLFGHSKNGTSSDDSGQTMLQRWKLENVQYMLMMSITVSFALYWGISFILQWQFYIKRRHDPKEWKCQPDKFLTPANERHEFLLGSFDMLLGSIGSGFIATYIMNGGHNSLYFSLTEYGVPYLLLSLVVYFLYTDAIAYYIHRLSHIPIIYRNIHKIHHRYHQPTAFAAVAMHPAEFMLYQSLLAVPAFVVPIHAGVFVGTLLYVYYYGLMDHSGIMMDAIWPWQPPVLFHDNHHKYFHVNFGFNTYLFDWLHDTLERSDREYSEDIFYGRGRPKSQ